MKKIGIFIFGILLTVTGNAWAASAKAIIGPATPDSKVTGWAAFHDTEEGLVVEAQVSHASPGNHGFHIHEKGDCGDSGNAAGGHYNPDGVKHGFLPKDGFQAAHAGDFGNIEVGPDGIGSIKLVVSGLTVSGGKYNVENRSVIFHEKEDNFGQPTGNAGGRIGCGIIRKIE